jgi:hypothetical protein
MTVTADLEAWIAEVAARHYSEDDIDFIRAYFIGPCEPVPDKKWEYLTDAQQYRLLASERIGERLEADGLVAWDDDLNLLLLLPGVPALHQKEWLAAVDNSDNYSGDDMGFIIRNVVDGPGDKYLDEDAVAAMLARLEEDGLLKWDRTRSRYSLLIPPYAIRCA